VYAFEKQTFNKGFKRIKNSKLFCQKFFNWRLALPKNKTLLTCVWKKQHFETASEIQRQEIRK